METFLAYSGVAFFALIFIVVIASNIKAGKASNTNQATDTKIGGARQDHSIEYCGAIQTGRTSPSHRHHR